MNNKSLELIRSYDRLMFDSPEHMEYFDNSDYMNYGFWDETTIDQSEASTNLLERLLGFIPDKRGTILDVACGKGASTKHLLSYYPANDVTAINISERQLDMARQNAPGCNFYIMDATKLEFEDASFDNIICVEAAFHFDTREKFLSEALRVLKPGGRLVLSDILMHLEAEQRREFREEKNYVKGPGEYEELLLRMGFSDIEVVDATEECWRRHYRHAIYYFHERFLFGKIDKDVLENMLYKTYRRVPDTQYYLLAVATKP